MGAADWASPSDPKYLGLLARGAHTITTFRMPLRTSVGMTTRAYVWQCPDCGEAHDLSVEAHAAVHPAEWAPGIPAVIRSWFQPERRLYCNRCGVTWEPHMLAPYDPSLDEYQLVCTRWAIIPLFPRHFWPLT